jgi:hypothetical protein
MTNSQPQPRKPTPRQLSYLKDLALATGGSFAYPQSFEQADREIKRLRKAKRTPTADRRREARELSREMAERRGDAAAPRAGEIGGYGASATWR